MAPNCRTDHNNLFVAAHKTSKKNFRKHVNCSPTDRVN